MKYLRYMLVVALLALSGAAGFWLSLHRPAVSPQIMETFHSPATLVRQLEGDPDAGQKIFHAFCAACHASPPQIDIDAPRIGDPKAWVERQKWGRKTLLRMTLQGVGAMPARGGCFECSDQQIGQAINYILNNSK